MSIVPNGPLEAMVGDPDDHRPESRWRLVVDASKRSRYDLRTGDFEVLE